MVHSAHFLSRKSLLHITRHVFQPRGWAQLQEADDDAALQRAPDLPPLQGGDTQYHARLPDQGDWFPTLG